MSIRVVICQERISQSKQSVGLVAKFFACVCVYVEVFVFVIVCECVLMSSITFLLAIEIEREINKMNKARAPPTHNYNDQDEEEDYENEQDNMPDYDHTASLQNSNQHSTNKPQPRANENGGHHRHTNSEYDEDEDGNFYSEVNSRPNLHQPNGVKQNAGGRAQDLNVTASFEQQQKNQTQKAAGLKTNLKAGPVRAKQLSPSNSQQPSYNHTQFQQQQQNAEPVSVEQMSEINHKLKEELAQLIERLEVALTKFKERKEKDKQRYGINALHSNLANVPEDLLQKERDLKQAQQRSVAVKKEIQKLKRKLETNVDLHAITELENEIRSREQALSRLEDANQQIKKVGVNQQRAMEDLNKEEELQQQLANLNLQMRQVKTDTRQLQEQCKELEKQLQEEHKHIYDLEERHRKINALLTLKRRKPVQQQEPADPDDLLTEEELAQQVQALEEIREEREKKGKRRVAELDRQIALQKEEQEINEVRLKDKDLQLKNAELRIKELKRQIQMLNSSQQKTAQEEKNREEGQSEDGNHKKHRLQSKRHQVQQNQQHQQQQQQ